MTQPQRKKILFLITKSNWGGAQRYVFDLAHSLNSQDFDIVVAFGGNEELSPKLHECGIRTVSLKRMKNTLSIPALIGATVEVIRLLYVEKPDIVHSNSSIAGFIGSVAGRCARIKKIIFTAHGWAFNEDRTKTQKYIFKFFHWLTVFLSHKTIAVSQAMVEQMDWVGARTKIIVIHPGRNITELKSKADARGILETKVVGNEANLSDFHTDLWIGTIAELHPIKQLNRAINSVAILSREHKNIRYVIIGDGQLAQTLQQQVSDLGVTEHVFFTGAIHEAARFLKAFDIFVLPSQSEAFGYVLLEAGLAHVPVVATNVGGIPDIITDTDTGLLVPPNDTPALTDALYTLLLDKNLRAKLADTHKRNAQTYTIEKMAEETLQVYFE